MAAVAGIKTRYGNLIWSAVPLLVVSLALAVSTDGFLTATNLTNVIRQSAITTIVAAGMTIVILTSGLDLAVGSIVALTSVTAALLIQAQVPPLLALAAALSLGLIAGIISGTAIAYGKAPPFIATLAMLSVARGAALSLTDGQSVTGLPESVRWLGTGRIGAVDVPVVIAAVVIASAWFVLKHTKFGTYIYAIGTNRKAAQFAAIPVRKVEVGVYAISGALAALSGLILMARLDSAQPTAQVGLEFEAIAAVVIGGNSLAGGKGSLAGTVLGVLLLATIRNGLNLLDISSFYQGLISGLAIVAAVIVQRRGK